MPGDDGLPDLSRVVVVGTSCSGKSTFARQLAGLVHSEHVELDALYWLPGWIERDTAEFLDLVRKSAAKPSWIADGNYRKARDLLWSRASAVIWLDFPFPLVLWRALKRTFKRAFTGQEICNGNREDWRKSFFSRESILLWVITTYHERRHRYHRLFADEAHGDIAKIRLTSPAQARAFLASVRTPA